MSGIEKAFESWGESIRDVYSIIIKSPQEWNPDVWGLVNNINTVLTFVATSLLVMFFFLGFMKKVGDLREVKRPEVIVTSFIRLAIAVGFVSVSMQIMVSIFEIFQGMLRLIFAQSGFAFSMSVPKEISSALEDVSFFDEGGIEIALIGLILRLAVFIISILLIVIVWSRYLKLYLHFCVAGCFFSTFASESTQNIGFSFIKSFANVAFQAVIILLALMIYTRLLQSDHSEAISVIKGGDPASGLLIYSKQFFIGALVTLTLCKEGDSIASKMGL